MLQRIMEKTASICKKDLGFEKKVEIWRVFALEFKKEKISLLYDSLDYWCIHFFREACCQSGVPNHFVE